MAKFHDQPQQQHPENDSISEIQQNYTTYNENTVYSNSMQIVRLFYMSSNKYLNASIQRILLTYLGS